MTDYPYAESEAAIMLGNGLRGAALERRLSLRQIGKRLGYSQPVVLSHWATGRTPIPIDRAIEVAREVGLPPERFLEAVLRQRHPDVDWGLITENRNQILRGIGAVADKPLADLSDEQIRVLREVVKDGKPEERWLSIPEVAAVNFVRQIFPKMRTSGFSDNDREALRLAADLRHEHEI
jgi:hypothetical protein